MTEQEMQKKEKIAYHQGALSTLIGERNELIKMLQTVETLAQAHLKELEKLGVKLKERTDKE